MPQRYPAAARATAALALALALALSSPNVRVVRADHPPFGYQSGDLTLSSPSSSANNPSEWYDLDTYPGSMHYDPRTKLVYITGGSYGSYFDVGNSGGSGAIEGDTGTESDCFLAVLSAAGGVRKLADGDDRTSSLPVNPASQLRLLHSLRIGTADHPEVCSSLNPSVLDASDADKASSRLTLIGHTVDGGYLTGLREVGGTKATSYGYALQVDLDLPTNSARPDGIHEVPGGRLFHSSKVQYPVALAAPPLAGDSFDIGTNMGEVLYDECDCFYVAVVDTDDDSINPYTMANGASATPDLTAGTDPDEGRQGGAVGDGNSYWHKYGTAFDITIMKLERKSDDIMDKDEEQVTRVGGKDYGLKENMRVLWEQPFATSEEGDSGAHPGALLADLTYVPHVEDDGSLTRSDFLLMAGSTRGYGSAFGSEVKMDGDWDGFLTKLSPSTGEELKPANQEEMLKRPHSIRIRSENGMDDVIRGVCVQPDAGDVRYVYVAGSTRGIFDQESLPGGRGGNGDPMDPLKSNSAFVVKVDLDAMEVAWKRQFVSDASAVGTGCAVSPDGTSVYLAGVVADGGTLTHKNLAKTISGGEDDVFVAKLDAGTGETSWMRQMGTSQDEWLAKGGGIAADEDGGVVLYGGTRGSFLRWRGDGDGDGAGDGADHDHEEGKDDDDGQRAHRRLDGHAPFVADVFVMSVSRDGFFLPAQEGLPHTDDRSGAGPNGPTNKPDPTFPDQPAGNQDGPKVGMSSDANTGRSISKSLGFFLLTIAGVTVAFVLFASAYRIGANRAKAKNHGADISHENVTKYLQDFDEVDVAIRATATGGWHGMYDFGDEHSKLKAGLGKIPDEVTVTLSQVSKGDTGSAATGRGGGGSVGGKSGGMGDAGSVHSAQSASARSASHSSFVKDALFLDDDDDVASKNSARAAHHRASFSITDDDDHDRDGMDNEEDGGMGGEREREPDTPWGAGYAGLVESYNNTWDDRNPHSLGSGGEGTASIMPMAEKGAEYGEEDDPKLNEIL